MSDNQLGACITQVAKERNCDVYLFAGVISKPNCDAFIKCCPEKTRSHAFLLLASYGGEVEAAFRLTRHLQSHYGENWSLYIPALCKSAGTLVALGAGELVMSIMGELGPLDVQVREPDELWEHRSGLIPTEALKTIQREAFAFFNHSFLEIRAGTYSQVATRTAAEIASQLTIGLFEPLVRQIDPLRDAHNRLLMRIAEEYGKRLGTPNVKEGTLHKLVYEYPSHEFVVDFQEAKELFEKVNLPTTAEHTIAEEFSPHIAKALTGIPLVAHLSSEQFLKELAEDEESSSSNSTDEFHSQGGEK